MTDTKNTGIADAIRAAGSQDRLASMLGCKQQNVSFWLRRGYVPVARVVEVEQVTGVSRDRLVKPGLLDLLDTRGV